MSVKTIRGKDGNDVVVVTRAQSKKRQAGSPMFGRPESVLGERIQKDVDNALLYASLDALMRKKDA